MNKSNLLDLIQTKMCFVVPITAVVGLGVLYFRECDLFVQQKLIAMNGS